MDPAIPLLIAMGLQILILQLNQRLGSPLLAIVNRWLRWAIFSVGAAYLCREFNLVDRPFWLLVTGFSLLWFLLETVYNWLAISALSLSPLPLFPKYSVHSGGEEWPVRPWMARIRGQIRGLGFSHMQSLRAEISPGILLRVAVYDDAPAGTRVQVMFLPQPKRELSFCFVITSFTGDGRRIVTDNIFIPFGGFYPEDWSVVRRPWIRSFGALLGLHQRRLAGLGSPVEPIALDPWTDITQSQQELDRLNTNLGFLRPPRDREELGKITQEGRYRVWKEIWTLDYLGRAMRY